MADDFGAWEPPVDKRAVTEQQFARAGISTEAKAAPEPPPMSKATRDRLVELDARDGFLHPADSRWAISPTLAKMLRYTAGDAPEARDD